MGRGIEGLEEGLCVVDTLAAEGYRVAGQVCGVGGGAEGDVLGGEEGHWAAEFAVEDVEVWGEGGLLKVGGPVGAGGQGEGGGGEDGRHGGAAGWCGVGAEVGLGVVE